MPLEANTSAPAPTATAVSGPGPDTRTESEIEIETDREIGPDGTAHGDGVTSRPDWLGRRSLPTTPDGEVVVPQTTPDALRNRRFATIDMLAPPADDTFVHRVEPVPSEVLARSTWIEGCPVPVDALRYVTLSFRGFDGRVHTGELIVNAEVANDVVSVFKRLFEADFPMEEMRVISQADLDAEATGDGNDTTGFVCRSVTGGTSFSQHAYGLAIDINPFQNPYRRGEVVLPELAEAFLDRSTARAGMIEPGDVVVRAFAAIGWEWGGNWQSLEDYQHFALNNR